MWKDRANALQLQRYTEAEQYGELAGRSALTILCVIAGHGSVSSDPLWTVHMNQGLCCLLGWFVFTQACISLQPCVRRSRLGPAARGGSRSEGLGAPLVQGQRTTLGRR
jgi:hypothetical protein